MAERQRRKRLNYAEVRAGLVAVLNAHEDCRGLIRALEESALPLATRADILESERERMRHLLTLRHYFEGLERDLVLVGVAATLRPRAPANTNGRRLAAPPMKSKKRKRTA
jgi:hypothetical protein